MNRDAISVTEGIGNYLEALAIHFYMHLRSKAKFPNSYALFGQCPIKLTGFRTGRLRVEFRKNVHFWGNHATSRLSQFEDVGEVLWSWSYFEGGRITEPSLLPVDLQFRERNLMTAGFAQAFHSADNYQYELYRKGVNSYVLYCSQRMH